MKSIARSSTLQRAPRHLLSPPTSQHVNIHSQLSPALCNVAITLIEHTWQTTYHTFLHQPSLHLLNTRYVDNRYILLNEQYRSALPITTLAHPDFYEHPVEIEPVDDDHLPGFLIDPLNRTVTFQLPTHPWQIRDLQSAGVTDYAFQAYSHATTLYENTHSHSTSHLPQHSS